MIKQAHRTSIFNIKVDLSKSHGSYLFDVNTNREVLDLFGMYSSVPIGYNHPIFHQVEFINEMFLHSTVKVSNCEMDSLEVEKFIEAFTLHPSMTEFSHFHFCCTGALAIEAAVKTAVYRHPGSIMTFTNNFHGINSYGGILASKNGPAAKRLAGFFTNFGCELPNPNGNNTVTLLERCSAYIKAGSISAVLVEPIHCTAGDLIFNLEFLLELRKLCTEYCIPLIFDEIQTGFGGTGSMWYFEKIGINPDIVVFGKKTQVSGIMVKKQFSNIFKEPGRLEVTWDGDVIDMIRCRAILQVYEKERILANVEKRGYLLEQGLVSCGLTCRRVGLLIALDFDNRAERDHFVKRMWDIESTIMIPTGECCVRLRPNLAITEAEIHKFTARVARTMSILV